MAGRWAVQRRWLAAPCWLALALLSACGGGGGDAPASTATAQAQAATWAGEAPITEADAYRFLQQASFGPSTDTVAEVQALGYAGWVDAQWQVASAQASHLQMVEASASTLGTGRPSQADVVYSWWTHALKEPNQLRHRVAYALSQIFVVSTQNSDLAVNGRMVASYMDMLTQHASGTYRELIEAVALHPAMGIYLSHLHNRKEDPASGRTPDENFARELMQLFSIGLYELNADGSLVLRNGQPVPTYSAADVAGMAKVWTGWSWYRPPGNSAPWSACFWRGSGCNDPSQDTMPMTAYPQEHATSEKRFLGVVVPVQTSANPQASMKAALDRLANHPNTAPFISRQLIQRLVSSNPSAAYIGRVSAVFRQSGGSLPAVVNAILLDPEARDPASQGGMATFGKIKEPVLRLTQLLRAVEHRSASFAKDVAVPFYRATETDNPAFALGQTPLRAPSVFNFYRPAYVPPQTALAEQALVSPEMQLTTETSVVGYVNFMADVLRNGWGDVPAGGQQRDIQFDTTHWQTLDTGTALAGAQALVDEAAHRLLGRPLDATQRALISAAVASLPRQTSDDRRQRVQAAWLAILALPAYIVQQ